jgi:hypothetical protein
MREPKRPLPDWMKLEFQIPNWLMPAFGVLIAGAAGWWVFLAMGLGWMSPESAAQMSVQKSRAAVVAFATPACVARFERQPNAVATWNKLKSSKQEWSWADFIRKENSLIAEPGQKLSLEVADAIATACATELLKLKSIGGVKLNDQA